MGDNKWSHERRLSKKKRQALQQEHKKEQNEDYRGKKNYKQQ